jgi:NTE family protein
MNGIEAADAAAVERLLARHLNVPLDIPLLEHDLTTLTGLDRYQATTWQITDTPQGSGLSVQAQPKSFAPPFLMLGLNIENTTSESFRVQLAGRYLAFDVLGSGSEVRIDAGLGADPSVAAALYKPIVGRLFARAGAGVSRRTFNFVSNDEVVAQYREQKYGVSTDAGVNISTESEVSAGFEFGHVDDSVRYGDPSLPELSGPEIRFRARWLFDQQDSPIIPSHGVRATFGVSHSFNSPEAEGVTRTNNNLTQAELGVSSFHPMGQKDRLFAMFTGGTSFGDHPLPTRQFSLGYPYVLDAFHVGEERGDHYAVLTLGAMHQVARLPDFIGGPLFAGAWWQNGAAFDTHENADLHSQIGLGVIADTLIGPVLLGTSFGFDGGWRVTFGVGRIFR